MLSSFREIHPSMIDSLLITRFPCLRATRFCFKSPRWTPGNTQSAQGQRYDLPATIGRRFGIIIGQITDSRGYVRGWDTNGLQAKLYFKLDTTRPYLHPSTDTRDSLSTESHRPSLPHSVVVASLEENW